MVGAGGRGTAETRLYYITYLGLIVDEWRRADILNGLPLEEHLHDQRVSSGTAALAECRAYHVVGVSVREALAT